VGETIDLCLKYITLGANEVCRKQGILLKNMYALHIEAYIYVLSKTGNVNLFKSCCRDFLNLEF
jgi:hypothetical protein